MQIFISYSRQSQSIVKTLTEDLKALGHDVWFDRELTGGQAWWDQILARIRECDLFIFALAPEALDSYACKLEYTYAADLSKAVLPVLVADGVSMSLLPPELSKIQFVDYQHHQDKQAAFDLIKALNNLPAPQPLPDPLPQPPEVPISYLSSIKDQIEAPKTLSFEEQTALVLKLKERLREVDDSTDVRSLLERLRKRDDLYAKVAEEIDAVLVNITGTSSGPSSPPKTETSSSSATKSGSSSESTQVKEEWRAELVSKEKYERTIRVFLTQGAHFIEFVDKKPKEIVTVDGEIVISKNNWSGTRSKHDFHIKDGPQSYSATIEMSFGFWGNIKKFRLSVAGRTLYSERDS